MVRGLNWNITVLVSALLCAFSSAVYAEQDIAQGNAPLTASARLDFEIRLGKFIFFRVGQGAFPQASPVVDEVRFIQNFGVPASLTEGNNNPSGWTGVAPTVSTQSIGNVVPVHVVSNGGRVSIRSQSNAPLTSGSDTIPINLVGITSSDAANFPAPVLTNGPSPAVNVSGTAFGGLVTNRTANWTFALGGVLNYPAGNYTANITFTASTL